MASPTKNQKIESLVKLVKKRSQKAGLTPPPQRTVLETLMYAALLENAPFDRANLAYTVLENYYIDWNEIRVCSNRELADTLSDLPNPEAAAERVRKALQEIFEKMYVFDLEEMRKKGKALAEHIKTLESMSAGTPYMIQYTAQVALDGHLIPMDEASLRIMRRLGLSQRSSDGTQEVCTGLDRVVLKKSGLTFAAQLHHFAASYYDVPDSPELLGQLSAIDPEAVNRSWTSPILATSSVPSPPPVPKSTAPPAPPIRETEEETKPEKTPADKPQMPSQAPKDTSVKKPAKPGAKSTLHKPSAKPVKKPMPVKPSVKSAAKTPSKPTKPAGNVKKTSKTLRDKKPVKPMPSKRKVKVVGKKSPVKPVKKTKPKSVSPSKALRKRKPK